MRAILLYFRWWYEPKPNIDFLKKLCICIHWSMVIRHKGYAAEKVSRKFAELPKKTFMRSWIIHCYVCGLKEIVSLRRLGGSYGWSFTDLLTESLADSMYSYFSSRETIPVNEEKSWLICIVISLVIHMGTVHTV